MPIVVQISVFARVYCIIKLVKIKNYLCLEYCCSKCFNVLCVYIYIYR